MLKTISLSLILRPKERRTQTNRLSSLLFKQAVTLFVPNSLPLSLQRGRKLNLIPQSKQFIWMHVHVHVHVVPCFKIECQPYKIFPCINFVIVSQLGLFLLLSLQLLPKNLQHQWKLKWRQNLLKNVNVLLLLLLLLFIYLFNY